MRYLTILLFLVLSACASQQAMESRRFLDSTTHQDHAPEWVLSTQATWEKGGKVFFKTSYTIRGDERLNGCYDLARLDSKEALLSEIANDVKGSIDNAQQSLSENAETVLGKVRSGEFEGRITGLRFSKQYFERYTIGDTERIDCHVLGEITEADYNRIKRAVVQRVAEVDPRLKEAIAKKQIQFFNGKAATSQKVEAESADTER